MTEQQLTDAVVDMAIVAGWQVTHFRPGRTNAGWRTAIQGHKGFPDLVMVRQGRLIFAELKSAKGRMRLEQEEWKAELETVVAVTGAVEYYVWRPDDWLNGTVTAVLMEGRSR